MRRFFVSIIFCLFVFAPQYSFSQLISISGYVKESISGHAIENATVYESLSGIGTITGKDGYYRLLLNKGKQKLTISGNGTESFTTTFTLRTDTIISADLILKDIQNRRVIAVGQDKKDSLSAGKPEKKH